MRKKSKSRCLPLRSNNNLLKQSFRKSSRSWYYGKGIQITYTRLLCGRCSFSLALWTLRFHCLITNIAIVSSRWLIISCFFFCHIIRYKRRWVALWSAFVSTASTSDFAWRYWIFLTQERAKCKKFLSFNDAGRSTCRVLNAFYLDERKNPQIPIRDYRRRSRVRARRWIARASLGLEKRKRMRENWLRHFCRAVKGQ